MLTDLLVFKNEVVIAYLIGCAIGAGVYWLLFGRKYRRKE